MGQSFNPDIPASRPVAYEPRLAALARTYDTWVMPLRKFLLIAIILSICTDFRLLGGAVSLRLYTLLTLVLLGLNLNKFRQTFHAGAGQWILWSAFAASLLIGGVFATNSIMFIKQWVLLLVFFSVTVAVVTSRSAGTRTGVVSMALYIGIFMALAWGWRDLLGFFGIVPVENAYWRPKSFFEEGNEFGQFMVFGSGYLLAAILFGERWQAGISAVLFVVMLPLLLINNSRGSYLGFTVECAALVALAMGARYSAQVRKRATVFLVSFLVLGGALFVVMQNVQLFKDESFAEFMVNRVSRFFTGDESVNLRKQYSAVAWNQFLENPLFGIGMGNLSGPLESGVFNENGVLISGDATSSNWVLDLLSEAGLVGTLFMTCFVGAVVVGAVRRIRTLVPGREYAMVAGNLIAFFGMLANGISYPQIYLAFFWMNMGLLISYNIPDAPASEKSR